MKGREAHNEFVAFVFRGGSSNHGGSKWCFEMTVRFHYGMSCHETASCLNFFGYLEWWNNGRGNGKSTEKGKCVVGDGKCILGVANVAQYATSSFSASPVLTTQDKSDVGHTLTDDQWNTILNMFKLHFEDGDWSG
ncbi:unnamed protein product [Vicia faba]|uniref:Uncharacterized protein n=1 Tax=Vicia faba TaxID=3906 RepID=A0AAV0ZAS6_VICFA|nr:unnamed protein product [Vicia faba]